MEGGIVSVLETSSSVKENSNFLRGGICLQSKGPHPHLAVHHHEVENCYPSFKEHTCYSSTTSLPTHQYCVLERSNSWLLDSGAEPLLCSHTDQKT